MHSDPRQAPVRVLGLLLPGAAERVVWVARHRTSTMTLGRIVHTVYIERDSHWEVSPVLRAGQDTPQGEIQQAGREQQVQSQARPVKAGVSRNQTPQQQQTRTGQCAAAI